MATVAQQVPEAIINTYDRQVAPYYDEHYCDVSQTLEYFASLSGDETRIVADNARVLRPLAMFACGLEKDGAGKADEARAQFETLASTYPDNPLTGVVDDAKTAGAERQADWFEIIVDWAPMAAVVCAAFGFLPCTVAARSIALVGGVVPAFRDCLPDFSSEECKSSMSDLLPTLVLPNRLGPSKSDTGPGSSPPKSETPSAPASGGR